jgi:hypothetical protein
MNQKRTLLPKGFPSPGNGMGQPGQSRQVNINLNECTPVLCECENAVFEIGVKLMKVPVTSISEARGQVANVQVFCCKSCGKVLEPKQ